MTKEESIARMALSMIPDIGSVKAKHLTKKIGAAVAIFDLSETELLNKKVSSSIVKNLLYKNFRDKAFERAKKEWEFVDQNQLSMVCFDQKNYPQHLLECSDSPYFLFKKGNCSLSPQKSVAIVGTRNATAYGKAFTDSLVKTLAEHQATVVSGLAYGIDAAAHQACLKYETPTIAVLGHGLDRIYPSSHRSLAVNILKQGSIISEFMSETNTLPANFPKRNRIVAGMVDAVIVVEGAVKGGAMVTANLTHGYQKELFAVPGRSNDKYSQGCNHLIKTQRAILLDNPEEIPMELGWETYDLKKKFKNNDFNQDESLTGPEKNILKTLLNQGLQSKDELSDQLQINLGEISSVLFELELKGKLRSKPGNRFELV